jgi:hypothetical protein
LETPQALLNVDSTENKNRRLKYDTDFQVQRSPSSIDVMKKSSASKHPNDYPSIPFGTMPSNYYLEPQVHCLDDYSHSHGKKKKKSTNLLWNT